MKNNFRRTVISGAHALSLVRDVEPLISNYMIVDGRASYEGMAGLGPPCIVVDKPYLPITFLLQVGKLLLYKKVKFIGMVCLPTIHRCLKSVHRLPESNKLLT